MNVFDIEKDTAVVKNVGNCTMCRECIRNEEFKDIVELGKENNKYECSFY